ncbi:MAG: insulinase family protein, partial [Bryobacteraceae bacterium]
SYFDQSHLPGRISINSFTPTETTGKAIDLAVDVLKRLHEKGLTEEQLSSAKAYLKGTYPSERLETSDQLAEILTEIELNDLNRGEVDDLFLRIDAVTVERANEITRKYYSPENLTFLLLGNAGKFAAEARKYAPEAVELPIEKPGFSVTP